MQIIEGFDFFPLTFDDRGTLESRQEFDALIERAMPARHRRHLHRPWLSERRRGGDGPLHPVPEDVQGPPVASEFHAVAERHFVVAGVYWPSKPFREDFDTGAAGTRGLHDDRASMADVKVQLDDLKNTMRLRINAGSSRRRSRCCRLSRASPEGPGRVRGAGPLAARPLDARQDRGPAADPATVRFGVVGETQ